LTEKNTTELLLITNNTQRLLATECGTELYISKNDQSLTLQKCILSEQNGNGCRARWQETEANLLYARTVQRIRGEILVEEGHITLGTKHGRWVTYDGNGDVLSANPEKAFLTIPQYLLRH
jgi:hypothetical protein